MTSRFFSFVSASGRAACLLCLVTTSVIVSCGAPTEEPDSPISDAMPDIELSLQADGLLQVTFRLATEAATLRFSRNPDDSRPERWQPGDQYEFVHADGAESLRRVDGRDFSEVSVVVPARYRPLPKDYAPFSPFTDGGLLIHTGQFHACPGIEECPDNGEWRLTVHATKKIVANGEVHAGEVTFIDRRDGTNVYIGDSQPLESSHFVAVIDAGLPTEIQDLLYKLFPPLMDYFTQRLGALRQKPALFASIDPDSPSGSGFNAQGGTLPGQVFIHLYGEKWAHQSADRAPDQLPFFFAHEAAHLYQRTGRDNVDVNNEQSWIHEGGADAFALLTMPKFTGVDRRLVETRFSKAVDNCIAGLVALDGLALNASYDTGSFDNYYNCGLVMNLVVDAAVIDASNGEQDLFDVWRTFISRVTAGEPWNQQVFLQVVEEQGAADAAAFVSSLASDALEDPEAFVRSWLDQGNVRLSVEESDLM